MATSQNFEFMYKKLNIFLRNKLLQKESKQEQ